MKQVFIVINVNLSLFFFSRGIILMALLLRCGVNIMGIPKSKCYIFLVNFTPGNSYHLPKGTKKEDTVREHGSFVLGMSQGRRMSQDKRIIILRKGNFPIFFLVKSESE